MSIKDDLMPNEKFAETDDEEAQAERDEDLSRENDSDDVYDRVRDDNTETLMESISKLLEDSKKLWYYKDRNEGLAKDIIQFVLNELKLKVKSVDTYSPKFQVINLEEISV
jgi:hypothetical protein